MTAEFRNLRLRGFTTQELNRNAHQKQEIYLDYDSKTIRVFDGITIGGFALLRNDLTNLKSTALNKSINLGTGSITASQFTGSLTGNVTGNVTGNAGTVTNGVVTTGSYANPAWITSISASKITGTLSVNTTGNVTGNVTGNLTGNVTGNASTATKLTTAVNINTVAFDGTADITVTANANTLTNTILAPNVITSSLTTVGTLGTLQVTGNITAPTKPTLKTHATNRGYVDKKAVAMAVALG